jgi:hypothetical protein
VAESPWSRWGDLARLEQHEQGGNEMSPTQAKEDGATRLIDTIERAENASLEAVRNFLDTVDSVFPHLGSDEGPRRKIIDSAFKMTEQLVSTSTGLAKNILDVTAKALSDSDQKSSSAEK